MNTLLSATSPTAGLRSLLRWSPLVVAGSLFAACGGSPPRSCLDVADLELYTGNEELLDFCFEDPEGEELDFSATSSDEAIGIAVTYGSAVNVKALSPGKTTITVTAEDPGGNTASIDFQLNVPNQKPITTGTMPNIRMLVGGIKSYYVDDYFRDPDGQDLFFTAESDNESVASAKIEDSIRLVVRGLALGEANVTVKATDPGGESAERSALVEVLEPVEIFHDDFDSNTFDWYYNFYTSYSYWRESGYVYMTNRYSYYFASAERDVDVTEWEYRASLGIEEGVEPYTAGLWMYPFSGASVFLIWVSFGKADSFVGQAPDANWRFATCCGWTITPYGESDAVNVDGEFTEMVWTNRNGVMTLAAGDTELNKIDIVEYNWPSDMRVARLIGYGPDGSTYDYAIYDWVNLWAIDNAGDADNVSADWHAGPSEFLGVAPPGEELPKIEILNQ